jgi:hypothetical protein
MRGRPKWRGRAGRVPRPILGAKCRKSLRCRGFLACCSYCSSKRYSALSSACHHHQHHAWVQVVQRWARAARPRWSRCPAAPAPAVAAPLRRHPARRAPAPARASSSRLTRSRACRFCDWPGWPIVAGLLTRRRRQAAPYNETGADPASGGSQLWVVSRKLLGTLAHRRTLLAGRWR